jgi:hypothetical protein
MVVHGPGNFTCYVVYKIVDRRTSRVVAAKDLKLRLAVRSASGNSQNNSEPYRDAESAASAVPTCFRVCLPNRHGSPHKLLLSAQQEHLPCNHRLQILSVTIKSQVEQKYDLSKKTILFGGSAQ